MPFVPIDKRLAWLRQMNLYRSLPLYQKYTQAVALYMRDQDDQAERLIRQIEHECRLLNMSLTA